MSRLWHEVCDLTALCDTAIVNITVNPVNDPPIARDDRAQTEEEDPVVINVGKNDSAGPAGEPQGLTFSLVSGPSKGTVVYLGGGYFKYFPNDDFEGWVSFVYQACDSDGACDTATVRIYVEDD